MENVKYDTKLLKLHFRASMVNFELNYSNGDSFLNEKFNQSNLRR